MNVDGKPLTETERLRLMADLEHEEEAVLNDMALQRQQAALTRYEEVREHGLNAQALRLTPQMLREMGPHERRQMLDFLVRRVELLQEKLNMVSRSIVVGELYVPDYVRESA